jgi:hypothetical protein
MYRECNYSVQLIKQMGPDKPNKYKLPERAYPTRGKRMGYCEDAGC